ncbi:MAG: insulinase family protein [Holosporales bacterium]|jgi:predicted Zn-dependent peptidase|nr:insulinase family protein [Holosporales bacterium]
MSIKKTTLKNGLTVATDSINDFESVSVGIFVNIGSVNETIDQIGISHFLEHMAFKGTTTRSASQISYAIESVGGFLNAYTGKEITVFHAKVLKDHLELAVDIIADIIQNSIFDEEELEKERGVIIQEIHQVNDNPDDLIFDLFQAKCFEHERLGTSILGNEANVLAFKAADLDNYLKTQYSTDKMILAASGRVDHDELVKLAESFTNKLSYFKTCDVEQQSYKGGFICKKRQLEQTHLVLGFDGISHTHQDKFNLSVMSTILGEGMSSRLFQEIREKRGLAYSVFSFSSHYRDTGIFGVYAACEDKKAAEVISIIMHELEAIKTDVTKEEVDKAKTQIKASLLMGLENSSVRMERMASQFLFHKKFSSSAEIAEKIDQVTLDSVKNTAQMIFESVPTLAVIGNGKDLEKLYDVF